MKSWSDKDMKEWAHWVKIYNRAQKHLERLKKRYGCEDDEPDFLNKKKKKK